VLSPAFLSILSSNSVLAQGPRPAGNAVTTVRSVSKRHLGILLGSIGSVHAGGVVGGSMLDPETIGNAHMRAHAREAQLFREVVTEALERDGTPHVDLRDKEA
jgi:hypothetical protein